MTSLLPLKSNHIVAKVNTFLAGLVAFSIVLPIRANALISVVVLLGYFIYGIAKRNFSKHFFKTPLFFLIFAHLAIQLLGLLHSLNVLQGYDDLERYFFALLLPIFIWLIRCYGITTSQLIIAFAIGTIGLTFYGIVNSMFVLDEKQRDNIFESGHAYFSDKILMHPSYLSLYLTFVFFFLLEKGRSCFRKLSKPMLAALLLSLIYIVGMLLFLRSQMGLIIFVLLCFLYAIIVFKKRAWLMTFLLVTISMMVFLLDANRMSTFFDTYGKNVSSALDNRFKVWGGAIEAIKAAPILGVGTGSEQSALNDGYSKTGYQEGIDRVYNAHNQYLQFWVRNGIIELVCFLALLVYSFRKSLQSSNYTFLLFNIVFSLYMLTESSLSVHKGIVFFYFFLSAFVFLPFDTPSEPAKDKLQSV